MRRVNPTRPSCPTCPDAHSPACLSTYGFFSLLLSPTPGAVQIWMSELRSTSAGNTLSFLYVANDVMQKTRKRGSAFKREFGMVRALARPPR